MELVVNEQNRDNCKKRVNRYELLSALDEPIFEEWLWHKLQEAKWMLPEVAKSQAVKYVMNSDFVNQDLRIARQILNNPLLLEYFHFLCRYPIFRNAVLQEYQELYKQLELEEAI